MEETYNILLAEDLPSDAELTGIELRKTLGKCNIVRVETEKDFVYYLANFHPDIVVSDYKMPSFDGISALKITMEKSPLTPFIIVTGSMNEDTAVECMKAGATDYVIKEHISRLGPAVKKALEQKIIKKEKYLMETALRVSEERFRSVTQTANDAIIVTNEAAVILTWNEGARKIFGYEEDEIVGRRFSVLVPLRYVDSYLKRWNQTKKISGLFPSDKIIEMIGLRKDGIEFPFEISSAQWQSEDENFVSAIIRDISERKAAENTLKESERRFRSLFENMLNGFAYCKMIFVDNQPVDFIYLDVNDKFSELTGLTNVIGKKVTEVIPGIRESDPELFEMYGRVASSGRPLKFDTYLDSLKMWFAISVYSPQKEHFVVVFDVITERKIAEAALKESEERYRTFINSSTDMIFLKDDQFRHIVVNDKLAAFFGKSVKESIDKTDFELMPEEVAERCRITDEEAIRKRTLVISEEKVNDEIYETTKFPVELANGKIGIGGFIKDITIKKKAEQKLAEERILMRTLIDNIPDAIYIKDAETRKILTNPADLKNIGKPESAVLNKTDFDAFPPEVAKRFYEDDLNVLAGNAIINREEMALNQDGEIAWLLTTKVPLKNSEGKIIGLVGLGRNITDRKKTDEKLVMLSKAVEQSANSIIITNMEGNIEYVNPKFSKLTGYSSEEVIGKKPSILKSGSTDPKVYKELWETIKSGRTWFGEFYNKKKNGEFFWESASISPVTNEDGKVIRFVAVKEDITDRKNMIIELQKAKEKAEEMNRLKSIFFANMSHELRTPFVGIIGFSEILKQTLTDPHDKEMAEAIYTSSQRLTGTLNEILNVTKLELDKTEIVVRVFDAVTVLNEVYRLYEASAQKKNLDFKKQIPGTPILLKTDSQLFREILNNLVHNAIKFTFEGSIELKADIRKDKQVDYLVIHVSDTGIGIPEEKREVIWEEFRQVSEGLNRSFEGSGLGLTIVKKYTGLLGGKIHLESEVNKGSTFIFELPINTITLDAASVEVENKIAQVQVESKTIPSKILIVEDDELSRDYIRRILSKHHKLELAGSWDKALSKVKEGQFDAILMDINLGHGLDGVELTQKIREVAGYRDIPIIAMTAYAANSDKVEFLSKGLSYYIAKPFSSSELYKVLNEALQERRTKK